MRPAVTIAVVALAAAAASTSARSLHTADDGADKASLSDSLPFLQGLGEKSRQLDLLNKTTSLRHWDPPTGGCAALLAAFPVGAPATGQNSQVLPNGDIVLYNPWTPWTCLTVREERRGGMVVVVDRR